MTDDLGEQAVIDGLHAAQPPPPKWLRTPAGDDAAIFADGSIVAADAMVEGVHWDHRVRPEDVGFKLARTNLSDIAACGAVGRWAALSLSLPAPIGMSWVKDFARGLAEGLDGVPLVGGDTTRSPGPVFTSLTVGGTLEGPALLRSGAHPGDVVWVSGNLGDAAAGFSTEASALWRAWVRPAPPLALGPALVSGGLATAGLDLSDGLAKDLRRLCRASGCGARIDPSALPASEALASLGGDILAYQVAFGEDYELLFTAPRERSEEVLGLGSRLSVRLTPIGVCVEGQHIELEGRSWPRTWSHFPEER